MIYTDEENEVVAVPANQPYVHLQIEVDGESISYVADPAQLYETIHAPIMALLCAQPKTDNEEAKRLSQMFRTALKGLLLTFGGPILSILLGSKDHGKPGKKDDIIAWYADAYTRVMLARAANGTVILKSHGATFNGSVLIDEIHTFTDATSTDEANKA